MTIDADALIVGVDKYDSGLIRTLDGCVNDARRAARLLIEIGMDPKRITIHTSETDLDTFPNGVIVRPATDRAIRASFKALSRRGGDQLFLFFSGHGKSVPGFGPIFLCQDYYVDESPRENLAIKQYVDWFLSWNYRDQFLFYDACQDQTTSVGRISPVEPSGPDAAPGSYAINQSAALTACYPCSEGETTWAGDGHGVLVRNVLAAMAPAAWTDLDPDAPEQDAIDYNWTTGERVVDLARLFRNIISQRIRNAANSVGKYQTPFCQPYGRALRDGCSPLLKLPTLKSTDVNVAVAPNFAFSDMRSITLRSQVLPTPCFLPLKEMPLELPAQLKFPMDDTISARCILRSGSTWQPVNIPVVTKLGLPSVDVIFKCQQIPPTPAPPNDGSGEINVVVQGGASIPPTILAEVEQSKNAAPDGITLEANEHGAAIACDPTDVAAVQRANDIATAWLKETRRYNRISPGRVLLSPIGHARDIKPNVFFHFGGTSAEDIAGYISEDDCVWIEVLADDLPTRRLSLRELKKHPHEFLEPGQFRVSIDLPWGRWTQRFRTSDVIEIVELPTTVGLEPLRNRFRRRDTSASITVVEPRQIPASLPRLVISEGGRGLSGFAELPIATLVLKTEHGLRIEPFSRTSLRQWDDLLTVGRLDISNTAELVKQLNGSLPDGTESEFLIFALAAAYAELNHSNFEAVRSIVNIIENYSYRPMDLALLKLAADIADGTLAGDVRQHAVMSVLSGTSSWMPVLRWGVMLLVDIIASEKITAPQLMEWAAAVDPTAVMTVFHEAGLQALGFDIGTLASQVRMREAEGSTGPGDEIYTWLNKSHEPDQKDLPTSQSLRRISGPKDEGGASGM